MSIDFKSIANQLTPSLPQILTEILPGGKITGKEYRCASILGGDGESFAFNLESQVWKDFASGHSGGKDIISLYAEVKGTKQVEAAKELVSRFSLPTHYLNGSAPKPVINKKPEPTIIPAPLDARGPDFSHSKFGSPSAVYKYADKSRTFFYVARYDTEKGKELRPYSFTTGHKWISKGYPEPRPLYMQDLWIDGKTFIVVEGEKAANHLYGITNGKYNITTWANGTNALEKADLKPLLTLQKILLWPDADEPGKQAMHKLASIIHKNDIGCEIYMVNTEGLPKGFDAADLTEPLNDFMKTRKMAWAPVIPDKLQAIEGEIVQPAQPIPDKVQSKVMRQTNYNLDKWKEIGIAMTMNNRPLQSQDTMMNIMENWQGHGVDGHYNEFSHEVFVKIGNQSIRQYNEDEDPAIIVRNIERGLNIHTFKLGPFEKAIKIHLKHKKVHPVKEWLESLKGAWDGTPRVGSFFTEYTKGKRSEYTDAVSKNFWVGLVARIYEPGCKLDNMVILEGGQKAGKSELFKMIASKEYFAEVERGIDNQKDFVKSMFGKWILEFGELASFSKAEVNDVKQLLSRQVDHARFVWEKQMKGYPRQSIFVGTTNDTNYLKDTTGGRRFWPIHVGDGEHSVDLPRVSKDREQLFAEAVYLYMSGSKWDEVPESAKGEQFDRLMEFPNEDAVMDYVHTMKIKGEMIKTSDIIDKVLKPNSPSNINTSHIGNVSNIMRKHGYRTFKERIGGKVFNLWKLKSSVTDDNWNKTASVTQVEQ